jgi:hypothetical protein
VASVASAAEWRFPEQPRVVVFGDVHGAFDALAAMLQQSGVVDASLDWAGGTTHLVSLGDLLDRGDDSRRVMDLLMKLETQAAAAGGRVHLVLGNHEVMNLTGDLRYVAPGEFAAFAASGAVEADTSQPRGFAAHRAAFAPGGRYGAWLRDKPAVVVIGDTAFVHGGLTPVVGDGATLNARVHALLANAVDDEALVADAAFGETGPFWYRGSARCHVLLESDTLDGALEALNVRRVVVGHTPTESRRVESRFDGRVLMVDTGMLATYYKGRTSALVLEASDARVVVKGEREPGVPLPTAGAYSGDWRERLARAEAYARADIVERNVVEGVRGALDLVLADGAARTPARFVPMSKGARARELAAFRLDRLLGLGIVRIAAARAVDGRDGLVVEPPSDLVTEQARAARNTYRPEPCAVGSDYDLVRLLDLIAGTPSRSADDLGYDRRSWEVRAWNYAGAFGSRGALPIDAAVAMSEALRVRLTALDGTRLREALSALGDRAAEAVLARRDALLRRPAAHRGSEGE